MSVRKRTSANDWQTRKRIELARAEHIAAHGPGCEICGTVPKTRGLQWDHDHHTGEHRGWLCWRCNHALPLWLDTAWLRAAIRYLERAEARRLEAVTMIHFHGPQDGET